VFGMAQAIAQVMAQSATARGAYRRQTRALHGCNIIISSLADRLKQYR